MLRRLIVFALLLMCFVSASVVQAAAPTRLHFARGQKHIVVNGFLNKQHLGRTYRLYAKAGQHLKIEVLNREPDGKGVVTMYHITFPSGKQFGEKGYDPFDGRLTETGTYYITVAVNLMATNNDSGRFQLRLTRY